MKPVNWMLEVWTGRVQPGHRAIAVIAAIVISLIVMGTLLWHGLFSKIMITPAVPA